MPFQLDVQYADRRVILRHHGTYTLDEGRAATADILALSARTGYRQLLADFRPITATPVWTHSQLYTLVGVVATLLREHVFVAVLYDPAQPFAPVVRFVESAAEREGLLLRGFRAESDALTWLSAMQREGSR